jgi:VCBS repeat-containing protein
MNFGNYFKLFALFLSTLALSTECFAQVDSMINSTLDEDLNGNGSVNPGDSLKYDVSISGVEGVVSNAEVTIELSSFLKIIPGTFNVLPYAVPDTNSVTEDSGNVPSGSMIANDAGQDPGETLEIQSINASASPGTLDGSFGTLTWARNGSYSYQLDNDNPTVNGLEDGQQLFDTFNYVLVDGTGNPDSSFLEITIEGTSDGQQG